MRKLRSSIKTRLTFVTVAFTFIITVTLVTVSFFQIQRVTRSNMLQSIEFNLHLTAQIINDNMNQLDRLRYTSIAGSETIAFLTDATRSTASSMALHTRLIREITANPSVRYLRRLLVTYPDLSGWVQVGVFSDRVTMSAQNLALLGDFDEAVPPQWSHIHADPLGFDTSEPIVSIVSPVLQSRGTVHIGYVYLSMSSDIITVPLAGYPDMDGGGLYLTLADRHYLISDGEITEAALQRRNEQVSGESTLNPATQIITFEDGSGEQFFSVICPVGSRDMTLEQTIPVQIIEQETYLFVRLLLPICLGVLGLGIFIAVYLSRSINKPVSKIRAQITTIAGGDFKRNKDIEWDNELGEIGRGINQLASDVEKLMNSRLEDEKRRRDFEYKLLKSQINPHFLYNTLNSIKWMATMQRADGIAEMTTSLSRLLKSIAKTNKTVVPLRHELALLEDYFVITRYNYGGAITTSADVPEELLDCNIPVFTLQPIVENAIIHGIEPKGGAGKVDVSAHLAGDCLEISVEDDGIGMDEQSVARLLITDIGNKQPLFQKVGIYNVHARIQFEYGDDYGLRIDSRVNEYTRVTVRIPYEAQTHNDDDLTGKNTAVGKIKEYICQNLDKCLTLKSVADEFGYSPKYISNLFAKNAGCTFVKFVNEAKIARACELITEDDALVSEVAEALGFENQFYFSKVFRKYMGMSPMEYRQKHG